MADILKDEAFVPEPCRLAKARHSGITRNRYSA
jgi:hypothetical protein